MPQISVIVPVYKSGPYLRRCVDSILCQTFSDFELILVDDGSPDLCGAICDEYAEKDPRVRVIHQENRGASAARNAGLDLAAGGSILFCDSDDLVAPQWMAHLYAASREGSVYPMCAYCRDPQDLGGASSLDLPAEPVPAASYYQFQKCGIAGFVCNGLFRRSILEEHRIRFRDKHREGNYNEDLLFSLTYIRYVNQIAFCGCQDYLYHAREGSLSQSWDQFYFKKYEEKYRLWSRFLADFLPEDAAARQHLAQTMLYHFFRSLKAAFQQKDYRKFAAIAGSDAVGACARDYAGTGENPVMVNLLRTSHPALLWMFYALHQIKTSLK